MPHLQVAQSTARNAHQAALQRSSSSPVTPLQLAHDQAKARARKVCRNESGVCSIYDLGEVISLIADDAATAWLAHQTGTALALEKAAGRLKQLIPALRDAIAVKPCPHCHAAAEVKFESERYYVECSNNINCPVWPQTQNQPSRDLAAEAWNENETR